MRRVLFVIMALLCITAAASVVAWFGAPWFAAQLTGDSIDPPTGERRVAGLAAPVSVRRDAYGVPLIEAQSVDDLAFATGWVMAADRYNQMIGMTMAAQGRIAEMAGAAAVPLDVYLRTLGVRRAAERHYAEVPPDIRHSLARFSDGVNAWADAHRDRLPLAFRLPPYIPERWTPMNSMDVYTLVNLGLSLNLSQELAFLNAAARVGPERAAWLFPTMTDEPLPFDEARKLAGSDLSSLSAGVAQLAAVQSLLPASLSTRAASNNWAIAPSRTAGHASILANDTHLLLDHPPMWMLMQARAPGYEAAGIALAGLPGIIAGYNGKIAWGMTMVMADGQDLFVEQLREGPKGTEYRVGDAWEPVETREEILRVSGEDEPRKIVVKSTRHGPLIDAAVQAASISPLQPVPYRRQAGSTGLALSWTVQEPDASLAAMWGLAQAKTMAEAQAAVRGIRYIHLNLLFADRDNIGWQVTGRYPLRRKGTGKFPSPGWAGEYDWNGWLDVAYQPAEVNPVRGFIGSANNRKVPAGYPVTLSSSWFYPERGERIDELAGARSDHSAETSVAMQADRVDLFARKLKTVLMTGPFAAQLRTAIGKLPQPESLRAMEALASLGGFDGAMRADSRDAAIYAFFLDALPRAAFLDELGPGEDAPAWQALVADSMLSYSATEDHLLQREDSPFWDDVGTADRRETKADIVARALADAIATGESLLGRDHATWQWGQAHTYTWRSQMTLLAPHLPAVGRLVAGRLAEYLDRGPYPAAGSHHTLDITGSPVGARDFDVELVPAMRMVVDFAKPEPLQLVIAGSQSDDPASPHYDDGIALYLSHANRVLPFHDAQKRQQHFRDEFRLLPAAPEKTP